MCYLKDTGQEFRCGGKGTDSLISLWKGPGTLNTQPEYQRAVLPATGNILNLVALLFQLIPKNLLSLLTGYLARLRLPRPLSTYLLKGFASAFNLDMSEAEMPLERYPTIEDLFTRRLKEGVRPIHGPLVSPADGYLAISAPCDTPDLAIQAKGLTYSLSELVTGTPQVPTGIHSEGIDCAWYQTIYLAPHNYHRVHAPFSGRVRLIRYIPGELWPVNIPFVMRIPRLFCRNERLVFECDVLTGGKAWIVMVGALNVGRMITPLKPELVTNALDRQTTPTPSVAQVDLDLKVGSEIGTFMLGSTVIVVYDAKALSGLGGPETVIKENDNNPVKMGQTLLRGAHD